MLLGTLWEPVWSYKSWHLPTWGVGEGTSNLGGG